MYYYAGMIIAEQRHNELLKEAMNDRLARLASEQLKPRLDNRSHVLELVGKLWASMARSMRGPIAAFRRA